MNATFIKNRNDFYNKIPEYWADLYGEEYSLYDIRIMTEEEKERKQLFAYRCGKIFFKTGDLLASNQIKDETLLELGFPKETIRFIRLHTMKNKTIIGRFDSVEVDGQERLLEFNSDTPTFIKELFHINQLICDHFNVKNPNKNEEKRLADVVRDAIIGEALKINKEKLSNVVFTSHENAEDKNTTLYLQKLSGVPSKYVPLDKLRIIKDVGLFDEDSQKIDILYRQTFPIESLITDEDPDNGDKVGLMLIELVEKGLLRIINPPSAFLLQNKAIMAVIWGLHEEGNLFFTEEEHSWIDNYFLPTYLENAPFVNKGIKYVKKPAFGREGDTVEIYSSIGEKIMEDENKSYTDYLSVYQQYVDLPKTMIHTEKVKKESHIMTGTFLLNGKPSAIGFRVGNQITDNLSYFLPCGMEI
ncbi:glutathionylspermidine synthase family protein [[Brevibacterium] frigoritolerans]|nr:glutathionylspermidine synthase family protein [Peribacillus frigoritolerans]